MARSKLRFEDVREIGLTLPEVEASTAYGAMALKLRGKLLACQAINKSAEPGSLGVRIDFDQREALLAEAPDTYYLTDHYRPYPMVLVRLSRIGKAELRDLLGASWRFVTSEMKNKRPAAKKRKPAPRA
jgi:hypothetical protein